MKHFFFALAGLATAAIWFAPACGGSGSAIDLGSIPDGSLPDGGTVTPAGGNVGDACDGTKICRPGLTCGSDGKCAPSHASAVGAACQISAECNNGYCGQDRKCAAAGPGDTGTSCATDGDCKAGLRCNIVGLATQCQAEGTKDLNGDCQQSSECYGGLLCTANKCAPPVPGGPPLGVPTWAGVTCEPESGDVVAYFDVPRGGNPLKDFFRLPFPNDIRTANGRPDLKDFPVPGNGLLGYDLVDRWARYLEKTGTGFSAYPTVTFRFSGEIDFDSLNATGTTHWVDLTTKSDLGHQWSITTARTAYVCPNALSFRPPLGKPLAPGHTYAVFVTTAAKVKGGAPIGRPADLVSVLATTNPGGDVAAAWAKYQPLRDWAAAKTFDLGTILNASVFTVGNTDSIGKQIATFVDPAKLSTATPTWTKCDVGTTSPCAQHDADRNCPATPSADFDEYHAVLTMPQYQSGNLPFLTPADDGTFVAAKASATIDVCASITVPKPPVANPKVVIYAHGTGGSFRSQATENVASRMAKQGFAVLGIDQVGHGTRRGASTADPSTIFFNFPNPPAAQGNVLQGAADQLALTSMIASGKLTGVGSLTFDTTNIGFWGHSQGATEGAIAMPYAPIAVKAVVLSGEGGSLIDSLLTKTSPTNLKALAPIILSENPGNIDSVHPVLAMFQNGIDPADPLNHAANINLIVAGNGVNQRHVFQPYGQQDTYATPITQLTYLAAANFSIAPHAPSATTPDDLDKRQESPGPVSKNNGLYTTVTRQYGKPATADGHFVAFDDPDAIKDVDAFLKAGLTGTAPTVPAP
jgi:pimeloyl-ACP methyl ester carboxylesterase